MTQVAQRSHWTNRWTFILATAGSAIGLGNIWKFPYMSLLAKEAGASALWKWVGVMGLFAGILILAFYSVIAGWVLDYVVRSASGSLRGIDGLPKP